MECGRRGSDDTRQPYHYYYYYYYYYHYYSRCSHAGSRHTNNLTLPRTAISLTSSTIDVVTRCTEIRFEPPITTGATRREVGKVGFGHPVLCGPYRKHILGC